LYNSPWALPLFEDNFITILSDAQEVVIEHEAAETLPINNITNASIRIELTIPLFIILLIQGQRLL